MSRIKKLYDEFGVIYQANKHLINKELKVKFIEALAELEDVECHKSRTFPKTRLHKIKGIKQSIYRADIDKISGWRIHIQYINDDIHLKDLIEGQKHNDVLKIIKRKKDRYD